MGGGLKGWKFTSSHNVGGHFEIIHRDRFVLYVVKMFIFNIGYLFIVLSKMKL